MCVTSCILQVQCSAGFLQVSLQVPWPVLVAVYKHIWSLMREYNTGSVTGTLLVMCVRTKICYRKIREAETVWLTGSLACVAWGFSIKV